MDVIALELLVIVLLVLLNGFFALSEAAILASRRSRLVFLASQGVRGAAQAVKLWENTAPFLSTVQLGITLLGVLAGAFGGVTIARELAPALEFLPGISGSSLEIALALVVMGITYLSIVAGELVPKRLALSNPERVAARMAPVMTVFARIARPFVLVLHASSSAVLRLLRVREGVPAPVTEEEVRSMLDQGTDSGLFARAERDMLSRVFRLGDYPVARFMVPRPEIAWIDITDPTPEIVQKIRAGGHARLPVCQDSLDNVVGYIRVRELLLDALSGEGGGLRGKMRQPLFIPESMTALQALEELRRRQTSLAIVVDEHGGTSGLVTVSGIASAVLGEGGAEVGDEEGPKITREADGSLVVDGRVSVDEFLRQAGIERLPEEDRGAYHTVAGLVMHHLGRLPAVGDMMTIGRTRLRVLAMDGPRIESVKVLPPAGAGHI